MKHFEKWFEEVHRKGRGCYYDAEAAYREALEWMLSQQTSICYSISVVPADVIRKELGE